MHGGQRKIQWLGSVKVHIANITAALIILASIGIVIWILEPLYQLEPIEKCDKWLRLVACGGDR